jgi:hypothetical protein
LDEAAFDVGGPAVGFDLVAEGLDAGAVGLLLGGLADAVDRFRCGERAEGFDIAPVERAALADFSGEELAFLGCDPGERSEVVGRALSPLVIVDHHRLPEAQIGGRRRFRGRQHTSS